MPDEGLDAFDILLSSDPSAAAPWVGLSSDRLDITIARLQDVVAGQPVAAAIAAQVLRTSQQIGFEEALVAESIAYSMLQGSEGFRSWRAAHSAAPRQDQADQRVALSRAGETLEVVLTRPAAHNAFDARMRDALCEALEFALLDTEATSVVLRGEGRVFSEGGDLTEFGTFADPGGAHLVRSLRSPAALARRLGGRLTARLHGACIGAGIEVPAAAARVTARRHTFFRLPEVAMGLIPGAGGTASLPRRIGRHRTCFMAISGVDIRLSTALAWGLVDAVEEGG